jgi:hypothetical protein
MSDLDDLETDFPIHEPRRFFGCRPRLYANKSAKIKARYARHKVRMDTDPEYRERVLAAEVQRRHRKKHEEMVARYVAAWESQ